MRQTREPMSAPKLSVENCMGAPAPPIIQPCMFRRNIGSGEGNRTRRDASKTSPVTLPPTSDLPSTKCNASVQPPSDGGHLFDLRFVHFGDLSRKDWLASGGAKRIERHSPVRLLARFGNLLHGVLRAFPRKNVFAVRIRKVINLFRLPGQQFSR